MTFEIFYGEPDVAVFMKDLETKYKANTLSATEKKLLKKIVKALSHLSNNPYHPGLESHEISSLTKKYKTKIFESYLENKTPSAGRIFWFYDEKVRGRIIFAGIEPHPESGEYGKVSLSTHCKKPE